MGGLHIEMAMLKTIGDWLSGSGWSTVMTEAGVTTEGRAESLLKGSHVTRGQWAQQVTAAALYRLQQSAYHSYKEENGVESCLSFSEWCETMSVKHPQFCYWNQTLELALLFLGFLRAQREGNFMLYVETLGKLLPWMFAFDHYHFSRWLSVHVKDLYELCEKAPTTLAEFQKGHFVTQKTYSKFSCLAHDQIHEQTNAVVKGDGGVIGITENESALRRCMIAGPETSRLLSQYEESASLKSKPDSPSRHHEQIPSIQKEFATDVKRLTAVVEDLGNPFTDNSNELYTLDTKVVMSKEVVNTVQNVEQIGKEQYKKFVEKSLQNSPEQFYDTISKNNLPLFKSSSKKRSQVQHKIKTMKNDIQLFSRMYIACQNRNGDFYTFFQHENHPWPSSLADHNMMRSTHKADLLSRIEPLVPKPEDTPEVDMKIIDGAFLVHLLDPKRSNSLVKTFKDYADKVFLPHVMRELNGTSRVNVVWDTYQSDSLKSYARQCRGSGETLRVDGNTKLPSNWKSFLRIDENKDGLFKYLARAMIANERIDNKLLVTTHEKVVLSSPEHDVSTIQPCSHEEADYRMMLHANHGYQQGIRRIMIRATDTDVVVLAIATASVLPQCEQWCYLVLENTYVVLLHIVLLPILGQTGLGDYCFSMLCQDVTQYHHFAASERRQHGMSGDRWMPLEQNSNSCQMHQLR